MIAALTQRWRRRRAAWRPAGETIRTADYDVAEIPDAAAKAFIVEHHYSGTYPPARGRFGLFRHGTLEGVAVFSQPVNDRSLTNVFPGAARDSLELGRLVLLDRVAANGESFFVARCFAALRRAGVAGVVSFSDPVPRVTADGTTVMPGHVGFVYQALSACYVGRSTARTLRLFPDGTVLSARAQQKIRAGEQGWTYAVEQLVRHGAPAPRCLGGAPDVDELRPWLRCAIAQHTTGFAHPGCHKFAWGLQRGARAALPSSLPYPKVRDPRPLLRVPLELPFGA